MKGFPQLRWEGVVAYVGRFEVGRIIRDDGVPGTDVNLWVSQLDRCGLGPVGTLDLANEEEAFAIFRKAKRMIEENWERIEGLMRS